MKFLFENWLPWILFQHHKIPWKEFFKSLPVWALVVANLGVNWGSSILLTQTPTYLNKILKFDIKSVSVAKYICYVILYRIRNRISIYFEFLPNFPEMIKHFSQMSIIESVFLSGILCNHKQHFEFIITILTKES